MEDLDFLTARPIQNGTPTLVSRRQPPTATADEKDAETSAVSPIPHRVVDNSIYFSEFPDDLYAAAPSPHDGPEGASQPASAAGANPYSLWWRGSSGAASTSTSRGVETTETLRRVLAMEKDAVQQQRLQLEKLLQGDTIERARQQQRAALAPTFPGPAPPRSTSSSLCLAVPQVDAVRVSESTASMVPPSPASICSSSSPSASPCSASAPVTPSSPSPHRRAPPATRNDPPPSPAAAAPSPSTPTATRGDVNAASEEYAAYAKKLQMIHAALQYAPAAPPPQREDAGGAGDPAATEAMQRYRHRGLLQTPQLQREPAALSQRRSHKYADGQPLVRRAPSTGVVGAAESLLPLRWATATSGNVSLSAGGRVCFADASAALARLEEEYADSFMEAVQKVVIPLYAMANSGISSGRHRYSIVWASPAAPTPLDDRVRLGFGYATREFKGYGDGAAAFLYLSNGCIAEGAGVGPEVAYGAPFGPGMTLSALLDLDRKYLEFFVDGESMGVAFQFCAARHPATLLPVVVFSKEGDSAAIQRW